MRIVGNIVTRIKYFNCLIDSRNVSLYISSVECKILKRRECYRNPLHKHVRGTWQVRVVSAIHWIQSTMKPCFILIRVNTSYIIYISRHIIDTRANYVLSKGEYIGIVLIKIHLLYHQYVKRFSYVT